MKEDCLKGYGAWSKTKKGGYLPSDIERGILKHCEGERRMKGLQRLLDCSYRTAQKRVKSLKGHMLLEPIGRGRKIYYKSAEE